MAIFKGTSGKDKLIGTIVADSIFGLGGNDTLIGNAGSDLLDGGTGNDVLLGGSGDDVLKGGSGNDVMRGGVGNDTYFVDSKGDVVDEQANLDFVDQIRATVSVNLAILGKGAIENALLLGAGNISATGSGADNILTGNIGNNVLAGAAGNDTLAGLGGNDTLNGGAGNDSMKGGAGNDTYFIDSKADIVDEEANTDTGDTLVTGLANVNLQTEFDGIENVTLLGTLIQADGDGGNNVLTGNSVDNQLFGGSGNDTINGGAGNDLLFGEAGNDTINGGDGDDDLVGGTEADTLIGGSGNDELSGEAGNDVMKGGGGDDVYLKADPGDSIFEAANEGTDLITSDFDIDLAAAGAVENATLQGTGDTTAIGNSLNNVINGNNNGANLLFGGGGDDELDGKASSDLLAGGAGDDILIGGTGSDAMIGGAGADRFTYKAGDVSVNQIDTIIDFEPIANATVVDVIDVSELLNSAVSADIEAAVTAVIVGADKRYSIDLDGAGGNAPILFLVLNNFAGSATFEDNGVQAVI